ncbi:hypothetical protein [Evtepia sp.]|uniref:hypothetical protein n=1 Tax=Evtepia sp. TaxID=2773933 RepID=UPI00399B7450
MKQDSLRKKQRGTASPANDFFLSYHIPKENARDFLGSGDFFAAGGLGRRGEGKKVKFLRYWGTNQGSGPSDGIEGTAPLPTALFYRILEVPTPTRPKGGPL